MQRSFFPAVLPRFATVCLSLLLATGATAEAQPQLSQSTGKSAATDSSGSGTHYRKRPGGAGRADEVSLGSRPAFLVDGMDDSRLKSRLQQCKTGPFHRTKFSISHRGAPLQVPEHTRESYVAAARQGAGIIECDATFTRDGELVCRHAQCDLHTTTNILETDLTRTCEIPFTPAQFGPEGERISAATAKCCTSELTTEQFLSLQGKMDAFDPDARSVEEFLGGTEGWRTDLYTSRGTLLTHRQSIRLFDKLGADFTPELKEAEGDVAALVAVFNDGGDPANPDDVREAQENYARTLIEDYVREDIPPQRVWAQSFNPDDVRFWIENANAFGDQAVYLDGRDAGEHPIDPVYGDPATFEPTMQEIAAQGVRVIAPPMWFLLRVEVDERGRARMVPSPYALAARDAGLDIIAWTFERSDLRNGSRTGVDANGNPVATYYYAFDVNPEGQAINKDSDMYEALDVLARQVGIIGIFSDWPETVTYYANCMGLD